MNTTQNLLSVQELSRMVTWKELEMALLHFYPSESIMFSYYKKLFWLLFNANPYPVQQKVILFFEPLYVGESAPPVQAGEEPYIDEKVWIRLSNFFVEPSMFDHASYAETLALLFFNLTYGNKEMLVALFQE